MTYWAQGRNADFATIDEGAGDDHSQPRLNVLGAEEEFGCGQDTRGGPGEIEEDPGRGASQHADDYAEASLDVSESWIPIQLT